MVELIGLILGVGVVALMVAYSAFSWGYVTSVLYNWFIVSAIPNCPHFTVLQFIGFSLFVNTLINTPQTHIKSEFTDEKSKWFTFLLSPWLTLFLGWLIHAIWF